MRTFSSSKPPTRKTRASVFCHGLSGTGKTTRALEGGIPLVICLEPKAESLILKLNPNAVCVVPENCNDLLSLMKQLTDPGFVDKGFTRIVLDSYTELTQSLANWILVHHSGNPNVEFGRRIDIDEYQPIGGWAMGLVKAIQRSGLPSIIICRSESKEFGRIQRIIPAGLGSSAKNLSAQLLPTVEARFDDEMRQYIWDSRPDEYSQRVGLSWVPQVWTGTADDFLDLVENGEQIQKEPEAQTEKPRRKRKEPEPTLTTQEPAPPSQEPITSQEETSEKAPHYICVSHEQREVIRDYLRLFKIDTIAFLTWANSKGLIEADGHEYGIENLRSDQYEYLVSLFKHERSRLQFIQHLNFIANKKTA